MIDVSEILRNMESAKLKAGIDELLEKLIKRTDAKIFKTDSNYILEGILDIIYRRYGFWHWGDIKSIFDGISDGLIELKKINIVNFGKIFKDHNDSLGGVNQHHEKSNDLPDPDYDFSNSWRFARAVRWIIQHPDRRHEFVIPDGKDLVDLEKIAFNEELLAEVEDERTMKAIFADQKERGIVFSKNPTQIKNLF